MFKTKNCAHFIAFFLAVMTTLKNSTIGQRILASTFKQCAICKMTVPSYDCNILPIITYMLERIWKVDDLISLNAFTLIIWVRNSISFVYSWPSVGHEFQSLNSKKDWTNQNLTFHLVYRDLQKFSSSLSRIVSKIFLRQNCHLRSWFDNSDMWKSEIACIAFPRWQKKKLLETKIKKSLTEGMMGGVSVCFVRPSQSNPEKYL